MKQVILSWFLCFYGIKFIDFIVSGEQRGGVEGGGEPKRRVTNKGE